ncbi:signal peptidase I [Candidatus Parcubacteria bacterium]|nr:signal peptidase I [Candidatus Parcubacteria bacterium]
MKIIKETLGFTWEVVKIAVIAAVIVIPIRYFIFQPFVVKGASMQPNFFDKDYLIVDEISYRFRPPERGEVIIFNYPQNPSQRFIKRIIGLPGETVEISNGKIVIFKDDYYWILDETNYIPESLLKDTEIFLNEGEYFVLGDNREHSFDSEDWGALPKDYIIGRVILRALPFDSLTKIEIPNYLLIKFVNP